MGGTSADDPIEDRRYYPRFKALLKGIDEPGDCLNLPGPPPPWLNAKTFDRGRMFYKKYLFGIVFSELLGLIAMFSIRRLLVPLVFTQGSNTPTRALKRYVSTLFHIITWAENDIFVEGDAGHKDIMLIRRTHRSVLRNIINDPKKTAESYDDLVKNESVKCECFLYLCLGLKSGKTIGKNNQVKEPDNNNYSYYVKDNKSTNSDIQSIDVPEKTIEYLNQFDMALTQYAFIGMLITHPQGVGLWRVSKDEMEGFIHFWRSIGWLLGMKDKYNICNGSIDDVRSLCLEIEKNVVIPNLELVTPHWEIMANALVKGINRFIPALSLPSMVLYLVSILNMESKTIRHTIKWKNYVQYLLMRFVFAVVFFIPYCMLLFNALLRSALNRVKIRLRI